MGCQHAIPLLCGICEDVRPPTFCDMFMLDLGDLDVIFAADIRKLDQVQSKLRISQRI